MVKYDRNGFKARPRQLILTQTAAYVVDEAKIKQKVQYTTLKGEPPTWYGCDAWGLNLSGHLQNRFASNFHNGLLVENSNEV